MKTLVGKLLFFFWKLQFKKVPISFKHEGYHCRECAGGKELDCGSFPCLCKPNEKLITKRFVFPRINNRLNKLQIKTL